MKTFFEFFGEITDFIAELFVAVFDRTIHEPMNEPPTAPIQNVSNTPAPTPITPSSSDSGASQVLLWDTPKHAYRSTRILCDKAGLSLAKTVNVDGILYTPADIVCSVIMGESEFSNNARNFNKNKAGVVTSVDYGICQVNSYFHIGLGKDFESVDFVLNNPGRMVQWMINNYKLGKISMWCAYTSNWYKHYLSPTSSMWVLGQA